MVKDHSLTVFFAPFPKQEFLRALTFHYFCDFQFDNEFWIVTDIGKFTTLHLVVYDMCAVQTFTKIYCQSSLDHPSLNHGQF